MEYVEEMLKEKPIILPRYLFNYYSRLGITVEELLILIFIIDRGDKAEYNPDAISNSLCLDKFKVMELLNNLIEKQIVELVVKKDNTCKSSEYISLDLMYKKIMNIIIGKKDEQCDSIFENGDIFATFEKEFGRTISSMECQIIKSWIDDSFSYELIMEALKEAVYNGATSLKYIETILYSWRKKGYKTKKEVIDAKTKFRETKKEEKEIFYYDWLNDDWMNDE